MNGTRRGCLGALGACAWPGWAGAKPEESPVVPLALVTSAGPLIEEVVDLIGTAAGLRWHKQRLPWARVLSLCERGEALAFGMSRLQATAVTLAWSAPVLRSHIWMVVRDESLLKARGVEDLRGHSVCITRGFSYGAEFEAAQGRAFKVQVADGGYAARLRMLRSGRCDVVLTSQLTGQWQVVSRRLAEQAGASPDMRVVPTPLHQDDVHFTVREGSGLAGRLPALNRAIARLRPQLDVLVNR